MLPAHPRPAHGCQGLHTVCSGANPTSNRQFVTKAVVGKIRPLLKGIQLGRARKMELQESPQMLHPFANCTGTSSCARRLPFFQWLSTFSAAKFLTQDSHISRVNFGFTTSSPTNPEKLSQASIGSKHNCISLK